MNWHFEGKYNLSGKDYPKESQKTLKIIYSKLYLECIFHLYSLP